MILESRQKCLGIIGLLLIAILVISVSVPTGLAQEMFFGKVAGNAGFKTGVADQDSRVMTRDYNNDTITDVNTSDINPDTGRDEALYNDNIQIWIFIVLIVLGTYVLIVGFVTYAFVRRRSSE